MKRLICFVLMVVVYLPFLHGDIYVKSLEHTSAYTAGNQPVPESDSYSELWFKDKMVSEKPNPDKIYIFDLSKNHLIIINHKDKTYVEMSTPPDTGLVYSDQLKARNEMYKETGSVTANNKTLEILGKTCKGYDIKTWKVAAGTNFDENNIGVWASEDVPFDMNVFNGLINCKRILFNRDAAYRENLKTIKGFQLGLDFVLNRKGAEVKISSRTVEISEKQAPEGTFTIPTGYTKKEKVSLSDL